jgi:uncharacterized phage infection (PIP) family protein YhgE
MQKLAVSLVLVFCGSFLSGTEAFGQTNTNTVASEVFTPVREGIRQVGQGINSAGQVIQQTGQVVNDLNHTVNSIRNLGNGFHQNSSTHPTSAGYGVGPAVDGKIINPMNLNYSNTPVFNGPGLKRGANFIETRLDTNISKSRDIKELVIAWMKFALQIVLLVAVIAIIWAGILYVTSFGDEGRTETARNIIKWVVIGIIIMLSAYAIVNTIMKVAG